MQFDDTPTSRNTPDRSPSFAPEFDVEHAFWDGEPSVSRFAARRSANRRNRPTRAPARPAGSRQHTQRLPITPAAADDFPIDPARTAGQPVDPLLRRIGLLTIATALVIPVAIAARSDDSPATLRATTAATVEIAQTTVAPGALTLADPTVTLADPTTAAATAPPTDPTPTDAVTTGAPATTAAVATDAPTTQAVAPATEPIAAFAPAAPAPTVAPTVAATQAPATAPPGTQAPSTVAATTPPTAAPTTVDPAAAHAAAVAACGNTYEVQQGDYWILLAGRIGTPLADLLRLNAATVNTPLYAGRRICLPAGTSMPATTTPATTPTPSTTPSTTPTTRPPSSTAPSTTPTTAAPPKSTTTTEPTPPPPANTYSKAEVEAIIREVWPDDLEDEAVRIATRESNLVPTVRNSCCFGLFQIYWSVHKSWLTAAGITSASQLYDPRVNANAALLLYSRSGGWGPWT